jgi:hypothetical protein
MDPVDCLLLVGLIRLSLIESTHSAIAFLRLLTGLSIPRE